MQRYDCTNPEETLKWNCKALGLEVIESKVPARGRGVVSTRAIPAQSLIGHMWGMHVSEDYRKNMFKNPGKYRTQLQDKGVEDYTTQLSNGNWRSASTADGVLLGSEQCPMAMINHSDEPDEWNVSIDLSSLSLRSESSALGPSVKWNTFEIRATRDIEMGEELLADYGWTPAQWELQRKQQKQSAKTVGTKRSATAETLSRGTRSPEPEDEITSPDPPSARPSKKARSQPPQQSTPAAAADQTSTMAEMFKMFQESISQQNLINQNMMRQIISSILPAPQQQTQQTQQPPASIPHQPQRPPAPIERPQLPLSTQPQHTAALPAAATASAMEVDQHYPSASPQWDHSTYLTMYDNNRTASILQRERAAQLEAAQRERAAQLESAQRIDFEYSQMRATHAMSVQSHQYGYQLGFAAAMMYPQARHNEGRPL